MTLKFDGLPWKTIGHLSYAASSFVHLFIAIGEFNQTGVTVWKRSIQVKIDFCPCDLEIWWMTLKNNRAPLYAVSSFVHHFIPIGEFKLELQSGNTQFVSNSTIFFSRVTLKFDGWPWKNNRAPFLYYIKLCASFQIHRWSQTWVTVRKRPIQVKIGNFLSPVTLKFDGWPWETIGYPFYTTLSFVHLFIAIGEFKLELQSRNAQFGSNSTIYLAMWPCNF